MIKGRDRYKNKEKKWEEQRDIIQREMNKETIIKKREGEQNK